MKFSDTQRQLSGQRFCALEYRPSSLDIALPSRGPILVIVHSDVGRGLTILVDPEWRTKIFENDEDSVGCLLKVFMERADSEPDLLLRQLSELNFGCLVTATAGDNIAKEPFIMALKERFVGATNG
jgi:hypothetical protein